ncbi:MAG TPA: methylated-DNA--[protein]-cysteine S-methyltransferase [Candidatus Cloacimonadota bacterium]|jgi:methylated-DNA-[protein]-cysteine S-methyltransferase|nr:methylated-DNA--[protein]-cysteine S-methyltransferase [Candidatus Cloacimonadota bacterium]
MPYTYYSNSPNSQIKLSFELEEDTIIRVGFHDQSLENHLEDDLCNRIKTQFDAYFSGKIREFDLPFFATGTEFQLLVWEELLKIPYGKTISYTELAVRVGKPDSARAVGGALGDNPVPILVPCHRVISSDGTLGGYSGGLAAKRYLLSLEQGHLL